MKDTKVEDDSFYLLTLAAVAKELKKRGLSDAKVFLAVGLPLTRFGAERNNFIKYLTKNKRVDFRYENEAYHIEIDDVAVFPQCYAAVVDKIPTMAKKTLVVDIGSWTIDIMPVINKSPEEDVMNDSDVETEMKNVCKYRYNVDIDDFFVSNFSIVSNSLYSSELKYVYVQMNALPKSKNFFNADDLKDERWFNKIEARLKKYSMFEQF